jgi:hypothetical protein
MSEKIGKGAAIVLFPSVVGLQSAVFLGDGGRSSLSRCIDVPQGANTGFWQLQGCSE